jgi:transcriptional regulator GlxA family with amidase domain
MHATQPALRPWLEGLVDEFVTLLVTTVQADALVRTRTAILHALDEVTPSAQRGNSGPLPREENDWVRKIQTLIHERYAERLTLDFFAAKTGRSKFYIARNFGKYTGQPIHKYMGRVRVDRAVALLEQGARPVDVARATGFADQPHMTRVFRSLLGRTPGSFRADITHRQS